MGWKRVEGVERSATLYCQALLETGTVTFVRSAVPWYFRKAHARSSSIKAARDLPLKLEVSLTKKSQDEQHYQPNQRRDILPSQACRGSLPHPPLPPQRNLHKRYD